MLPPPNTDMFLKQAGKRPQLSKQYKNTLMV